MAPGVTSGPAPPPSGPAPWGGLAVWSGAAETGLSVAASCRSAPRQAAWGSAGEARTAGARYLCLWSSLSGGAAATRTCGLANPAGEVFAICGSCDALGNWNPQNAVALLPENDTGESMLWKATIVLSRGVSVQYRYFKGYFLEPKVCFLYLVSSFFSTSFKSNSLKFENVQIKMHLLWSNKE
uniref:CBM20 domain-containing protein n=1 Tax=Papio anubis TaxID=9555 RepID=A0A8I5N0X0_PAPAN